MSDYNYNCNYNDNETIEIKGYIMDYAYALKLKRMKVNIKSLAAESKIIRFEEEKNTDYPAWVRGELRGHRVEHLRSHTRIALLAYACAKGIPYKAVENSCKIPPDALKIEKKLMRHGFHDLNVREWLGGDCEGA